MVCFNLFPSPYYKVKPIHNLSQLKLCHVTVLSFVMNTIEDIDLTESTEYESFNYLIDLFNLDSPDELDDVEPDYELIDFLSKYDL